MLCKVTDFIIVGQAYSVGGENSAIGGNLWSQPNS